MVPDPSLCGMTRGNGIVEPSQPRRFLVSPGFTPENRSLTLHLARAGLRIGQLTQLQTSAAGPCRSYHTARTPSFSQDTSQIETG